MPESVWDRIPGGQALIDWFGRVHRFHDAELFEINLASTGSSVLRMRTFQMTDKVDDRGYFILEKHAVVTITLDQVTHVSLTSFNLPGIVFDLEVTRFEDVLQVAWSGSYGVEGTLRAKHLQIGFVPLKP
jgi:hypothetical protein